MSDAQDTQVTGLRSRRFLLAALFGLLNGAWLFMFLVDVSLSGQSHSFDSSLLLALRAPGDPTDPLGPGWLEAMGRDVTALGGVAVLTFLTLAVMGYLLLKRRLRLALVVLLVNLGALSSNSAFKQLFDRERPQLVPHGAVVYTQSFPSGHSTQAAAGYLTLAVLVARVQRRRSVRLYIFALAVLLTLLIGISRIYLGVHWPTDVLAGWTMGSLWALAGWLLIRWLEPRSERGGKADLIAEPVAR